MKDLDIHEVTKVLNKMELELEKYTVLLAADGNASEEKALNVLKAKLAKVKVGVQKKMDANAFSKELLAGLPKKWMNLVEELVLDKNRAKEIMEVVKKIYDSNIKDQQDEHKKKVATQALNNSLRAKKESFTQADFHAEFDELFRSGLSIEPEVEVKIPLSKIKLPEGGIFEKKLGNNSSLTVKLVVTPRLKNDALVSIKSSDVLDNQATLELFKNEFDPIAAKITTKLLVIGEEVKNIGGYEWLSFKLKAELGNFESKISAGDFSFSLVKISGTLIGEPTKDFLYTLNPSLGALSELVKFEIKGKLEFNLKVSAKDRKLLTTLHKLSEELAEKIEELPDLIEDAQKSQSKARRARKNIEKAKSKGAKAIQAAKDKAAKADKLYKEARRKVIDYGKDIKKLQSKINTVSSKVSKAMQPLAKAIKGYFGKRAASAVIKFIPGLNIVSTIYDAYDIGTVVGPLVLQFANNFWEEITKIPEPVEIDDRVQDFFQFIEKEEQLDNMNQALADEYQAFFKTFNDTSYQDFKTKLEQLQGEVVYKSVEDYLDALVEKKAYFAEQMGAGVDVVDRETIRAVYVKGTAIMQEKKSKAMASKLVTIPSTGKEYTLVFEYEITKIEGEKYYLECIKSVNFLQKGKLTESTFPKGEKAIYEVIFKSGKKIETWDILSY